MVFARRRVIFVVGIFSSFVVAGAAAGCADTDPHYGPPEAIRGRVIDFGIDGAVAPEPVVEGGAPVTAAREAFNKLYATISPSCTGCHAMAGQPGSVKFFPPSVSDSYKIFQDNDYKNLTKAPPGFYNKGVHGGGGPALTDAQKPLVEAWSAAEKGGGTTPGPVDAGGGG